MRIFLYPILFLAMVAQSAMGQSQPGHGVPVGAKLAEGQRFYSENKSHYMVVQPEDGNFCIYTSNDGFVWCSMATGGSGSYLTMQADGNLVVYNVDNQPVWSTETQGYYDPKYNSPDWKPVRAVLENNGTLGMYTAANRKVWSSTEGKIDAPVPAAPAAAATQQMPVEGYGGDHAEKEQLNIKLPMSKTQQKIEVEIVDGLVIFESDMILGTVEDLMSDDAPVDDSPYWVWPNSVIPYVIENRHPKKAEIEWAINEINTKTNICMVPRTNQADYVEFINPANRGCWSYVGKLRKGGRQEIGIGNCSKGSTAHEILHAAGFNHTHSREDRDNFVSINFSNIQSGKSHNFTRLEDKTSNIGAYDFGSIMHYPATAFSTNGQNTINVKNSRGNDVAMGQRDGLSASDIAAVNRFYKPGPCKPNYVAPKAGSTANNTGTAPPSAATQRVGTGTTSAAAPAQRTGTGTTSTAAPAQRTGASTCEARDAATKYQASMILGERLLENEKLVSANGRFQLRGTSAGDFVIEEIQNSANCQFREVYRFPLAGPINNPPAVSFLSFNPDGNICIDSKQNKGYCTTDGGDKMAPVILGKAMLLELTGDGRIRLVNANGEEIWATSQTPHTPTGTAATKAEPFVKTKSVLLVNERLVNNNVPLTSDNNQYQCRLTPENRFIIDKITVGEDANGQPIITAREEIWNRPHFEGQLGPKEGNGIPECFRNVRYNIDREVITRHARVEQWKLEDNGTIVQYAAGGQPRLFCPIIVQQPTRQ